MAKLATVQLVQSIGARFTMGGSINQEAGAPPLLGFPHSMLSVRRVKDNMRLAFIKKLFINREIGTNVQTRYFSFKCMSQRAKATCATLIVFSCRKLWLSFGVTTCNLRYCQVRGKACHTQRGFVEVATWGRQKMKSTCSLSVQIHKKLGNVFVQPCPSPARAFLLGSCRLRTRSPWPSLWHVASTKRQSILHDLPFI